MTEKTVLMGYAATVEAIIFASDKPVRERELRHHIPDEQDMAEIIEVIQQRFDANFEIEIYILKLSSKLNRLSPLSVSVIL